MRLMTGSSMLERTIFAALAGGAISLIGGCEESSRGEYREFASAENEPASGDENETSQQGALPTPQKSSVQKAGRAPVEQGAENEKPNVEKTTPDSPEKRPATADVPPESSPDSGNSPPPAKEDPQTEPAAPSDEQTNPSRDPYSGRSADTGNATSASQGNPEREPKVLVKNRDFEVVGPEGALRVTYDDIDLLRVLNMEPVTPDAVDFMPQWLKNLDGQRIRIRGFMYPAFQETGLTRFLLARDNQICCFGRNPKIYDLFGVEMREGETTNYIQNRPFDVVGVFHIDPQIEDGELYQLYRIDDAIVIDR